MATKEERSICEEIKNYQQISVARNCEEDDFHGSNTNHTKSYFPSQKQHTWDASFFDLATGNLLCVKAGMRS